MPSPVAIAEGRSLAATFCLVAAFLQCPAARADEGDPLRSPRYAIDVFQGPVLGSSRAVGLSGAFSSIAEGVEGLLYNPAAVANRYPYSFDWWDYDLDFGLLFPTALHGQDFDNDGRVSTQYQDFAVGLFGGALQLGGFGFGIEASQQSYTVQTDSGDETTIALWNAHFASAFGFFQGQLVVGAGLRTVSLDLEPIEPLISVGFEAGALFRPVGLPFRVALVGRTDVREADPKRVDDPRTPEEDPGELLRCELDSRDGDYWLPCGGVIVPWELVIGVSWMFGDRAYNPPWVNPRRITQELREERRGLRAAEIGSDRGTSPAEQSDADRLWLVRERSRRIDALRESYLHAPRKHLLISLDLVLTGAAEGHFENSPTPAMGVEAFVRQVRQISGSTVTMGPRLGLESEFWPHRLKVRGGGYLEPSRFLEQGHRLHGTLGFDLRLFETTLFGLFRPLSLRVSAVVDGAPRYFQWAVSLGIWR